jgi:hypothetical protein
MDPVSEYPVADNMSAGLQGWKAGGSKGWRAGGKEGCSALGWGEGLLGWGEGGLEG